MRETLVRQDSRARLAAADVLLGRLLHDLKQPLNHIRVTAQDVRLDVMKDRLAIESLPQSMSEIEMAVDQVASNIDRLRAFSRQESSPPPRPVALEQVCQKALGRIRSLHPRVEIAESFAPDLAPVHIDPFAVEQALWELLDNAVRATADAARTDPRLEISGCRRDDRIVITVGDNGCGVPEDERVRIFEPFFSTHLKAAGLGLALALALANQAGGHIELIKTSEQGSTFEFCLPGA
jgi:signal transduction histidine kinase